MFEKPEADYYVDHDYPGWLVWDETMPAYEANRAARLQYDASESAVRSQIGSLLNRKWFKTFFNYLKQEPRDATVDKFRMSTAMLLVYAFDLMHDGATEVSFADIKEEVEAIYQDGSDKHQHRATAEILGALLISVTEESPDRNKDVWDYVFPFIRRIFSESLTPENLGYWAMFLHLVLQGRDPRRVWPIYEWLSSFRLDLTSNAAFKESSKIDLLQQCVTDAGWHYQLGKPILKDFLNHLDHPYKGVREAMAHTLASLFRTRNYESYRDVDTLVKAQQESSPIGIKPYRPSEEFASVIRTVFESLEKWRRERTPGQQTPSSYTSGSKTVLLWLDGTLSSYECVQLVSFFPDIFMEQLLHMMDVKEDPELQSLAYHVFRHLPNVPHRPDEGREFIRALIRIGKTSALWHQRLRILINMQVIYFRQLFLMPVDEQQALFDCVSEMLEDTQLEVRLGASTTLSGMIRCSPIPLRTSIVYSLKPRFSRMLEKYPFPKRPPTGTPTPEHTRIILMRHAAVLGLGALIQAFPYTSPPSPWLPETLAFLAVKASADPGMVGKSVKSILSDFKKTRQDTWHIDVKVSRLIPFPLLHLSTFLSPTPLPSRLFFFQFNHAASLSDVLSPLLGLHPRATGRFGGRFVEILLRLKRSPPRLNARSPSPAETRS
jgi:proteasome activator subunit 4